MLNWFNDEKFFDAIDMINASIYWKDTEGRYLGCNKYALGMAELAHRKEMIGKSDLELWPSLKKEEILAAMENDKTAITQGSYLGEEKGTFHGTKKTYLSSKKRLVDQSGHVIGLIGTSLDITEIKNKMVSEKKHALLEKEQKIMQIIDLVNASIYWKDTEGHYLGCNKYVLDMAGVSNRDEIIGKTDAELIWKEKAAKLMEIDKQVLDHSRYVGEETFPIANGKEITVLTVKNQLRDGAGNVIGLVGTSLDITAKKEAEELRQKNEVQQTIAQEQEKLRKITDQVIDVVDASIYWKDLNGIMLGCNQYVLNMFGASSRDQIIGKNEYDLVSEEEARKINEVDQTVMANGRYVGEETFTVVGGKEITVMTVKNRLLDNEGNVIGLVGTSLDITPQKEAEQLRRENEVQKSIALEQEKFKKIADQVAHDIRSPLASLLMIIKACDAIPERERVALRDAAITIDDIANNLLNKYRKKDTDQTVVSEERESVLVSPIILQILTDKKYQYQNLSTKFEHHFTQAGSFAWVKIEPTAFKRMLSNIINNAVDALSQKEGKIILHVDADHEQVKITIEDNGKGMTPELIAKIMNHIEVTEGKENGHGIGLTQVRETLQNNKGNWLIDSTVGVGSKVVLTFPRSLSQAWIAETIELNDDDIVVISDDDSSIHMAWDTRFDPILKEFSNLTVKHFKIGQETIDFINKLSPDVKQKIFMLTDYELLKQNMNGLDIIQKTKIDRSILVTSHYANKSLRSSAAKTGTKILPKQLASEVPINIKQIHVHEQQPDIKLKQIDAVYVDDDHRLLDSFTFLASGKEVDTYHDPQHFLDSLHRYHKSTKILLDHYFMNSDKNGMEIAEYLHAQGFTRLYLLSGMNLSAYEIPDYLTVIAKTDAIRLSTILKGE